MSILTEKLPDTAETGGKKLPLNTAFGNWIKIDRILQGGSESIMANAAELFKLAFAGNDPPATFMGALNGIINFYCAGTTKKKSAGISDDTSNKKKIYDFEEDGAYIYAAFLSQYGLDLTEKKDLHWWKFKALFEAIDENQKMHKIMEYRSVNLNEIKDKKQRKYYKHMKAVYALPDMRTQEQKEADIIKEVEKIL